MLRLDPEQRRQLLDAARKAAEMPAALAAIRALYDELSREIEARQPVCQASGKCCHFEAYGHRLFITALELAAFADALPRSQSRGREGAEAGVGDREARRLPVLSDGDGCRYQQDGRCSVHDHRPFGCRIFFCDPTAADWQQRQYEHFHGRIRALHEAFGIPYFYVEWREGLAALDADPPAAPPVRATAGENGFDSGRPGR